MKTLIKKISIIVLTVILSCSCFTACGKTREADQVLEIFIKNDGYGTAGVEAVVYAFAEQDWVKEKYPNLEIPKPATEKISNYGINKIKAPSKNNFDLIFETGDFYQFFGKNSKGESTLVELTDVFNSVVPNETKTVMEKMNANNLSYSAYVPKGGNINNPEYYDMGWCTGMLGLVYNPKIVANYAEYAPRTTDELLEFAYNVKNGITRQAKPAGVTDAQWNKQNCGNEAGFSFTPCGEAVYEDSLFSTWWAQYDSFTTYNNFWQGLYDDGSGDLTYDHRIYEAEGRLKAMEVMYEILNFQNKYYDLAMSVEDYIVAQSTLLKGEYAMTFCADWFDSEMKPTRDAMIDEYNASPSTKKMPEELYVLQAPIISDIVNQLGNYNGGLKMTDEQLSFLIALIDENTSFNDAKTAFATQYPSASELKVKDYNRLIDARRLYSTGATGHTVCIPSVSNSIDVAKDLLRFMATDVAQLVYIEATEGQNMPFDFDPASTETLYGTNKTVAEAYQEVLAKCSPMQQSRHEFYFNTVNPIIMMPSQVRNVLAKSGMKSIDISGAIGKEFRNETSRTPLQLFNSTKESMTAEAFRFRLYEAGLVDSY